MSQQFRTGKTALRPRANLIHILGDELISSDMVAVTELVKNAYDADATQVFLRFRGDIENRKGELDIVDNGTGMSFEIATTVWMEPATQVKRKQTMTARGRRVLGEKGIGRFAAARLSSKLQIITKQSGADREIVVDFDWSAFDASGYLDEIGCAWHERAPVLINDHGTILHFTDLRNPWARSDIERLHNSLSRLVPPFETIRDFTVTLELPDPFCDLGGDVTPSELLDQPHYSIKGTVSETGSYDLVYVSDKRGSESLREAFSKGRKYECGPFDIELRVWDLARLASQERAEIFNRKPQEVRNKLDEKSGVSIYRDDFRVFPYGEPNNDWLRLDIRRVQNPTRRVSNNQVVGCILISADHNPMLKDQTNREGIITSQALDDLQVLVKEVLELLEDKRYKERPREKTDKPTRGGVFSGFDLMPVRTALEQRYPADHQILRVVTEQEKDLAARVEAVQEVLARYRRLATLGQLVDIFLHEGRTPLNHISSEADLGVELVRREPSPSPLVHRLKSKFDFILQQSGVLSQLFKKMEPFGGRKRGRPQTIAVEAVTKETFDLHAGRIIRLGVRCTMPSGKTEVTVDPVELQEVFLNLLDNSLYWLEKKTEKDNREILVDVKRTPDGAVQVLFCDSGPGVPGENRELIFQPYFSTKPDGVGLGLSIVGEIAAEYDGELELVDGPLPGACFRITLRRRV